LGIFPVIDPGGGSSRSSIVKVIMSFLIFKVTIFYPYHINLFCRYFSVRGISDAIMGKEIVDLKFRLVRRSILDKLYIDRGTGSRIDSEKLKKVSDPLVVEINKTRF